MSESIDYVEVTVKVPKAIVDFLKIYGEDVKEYIENELSGWIGADIDAEVFSNAMLSEAIEKTGLRKVVDSCYLSWIK